LDTGDKRVTKRYDQTTYKLSGSPKAQPNAEMQIYRVLGEV